jgi:hypothetical protein
VTARALQRVVVRMHHDPSFVEAVREDPAGALEGLEITAAEVDLVRRIDPRAWGVDPARIGRVFEALRLEYPVSCALAEAAVGSRRPLVAFVGSPSFHACIQERGLLAAAFGRWVEDAATRGRFAGKATAEMARIELATVQVRRSVDQPRGDRWVRAPWVRVVDVADGSLALYQGLFRALADGKGMPSRLPRLGRRVVHLAVERLGSGDVVLGRLPPELAGLLRVAQTPQLTAVLRAAATDLGADSGTEQGILDSLYADRLLARVC